VTTLPGTFLDRIVASTRQRLAAARAEVSLDALRERVVAAPPPRSFAAALTPSPLGSARLIAEIKRASPSKGVLTHDFDPVARARAYEAGGAAAISVLTEAEFFQGSLAHLAAVRQAVNVPVLRKDFILDAYQIYEARAAGADAILLICALLDDASLRNLLDLTHALGMEALVEVHDKDETRRATAVGARVVGVNSRNLRSFAVNTDIVAQLRPFVPPDRIFVAESGIADAADAVRARAAGAQAILVGEALMRQREPQPLAASLAGAGGGSAAELLATAPHPFVKLCGIREPEHAAAASAAGADAIGLILAPARRQITLEQARAISHAVRAAPDRPGHAPCIIGVFVDAAPSEIEAAVKRVGLDGIQLSGSESPERCAALIEQHNLPVIKALRPASSDCAGQCANYSAAGAALLIEPPHSRGPGGNGQAGDWALAREIAARGPVLLAGGLTPDNVADAIRTVHPRGVDVSSGTETNGDKDPAKLRAFVHAAREAAEDYQAGVRRTHGA
jgi:indole-3-glycerol phosphate synthase/phosphoribosylanthranilate isomerase/anthranilate synthase/indole-3-glycerol phosphate synthase/phosphoribosylanthranilate isomerase